MGNKTWLIHFIVVLTSVIQIKPSAVQEYCTIKSVSFKGHQAQRNKTAIKAKPQLPNWPSGNINLYNKCYRLPQLTHPFIHASL